MKNSILYAEVCLVCGLVLLLLSIKVNKAMFLQSHRRKFFLVGIMNALLFTLDAVWVFVDNNALHVSVVANWLLNGAYYVLGCVVSYTWFTYSETVQNSRFATDKKYKLLAAVPVLALAVATVLSPKTGWLFYIDANNHYRRGPAFAVQIVIAYGYVAFTALHAFVNSRKAQEYRRQYTLRTLAGFVLPTLVAGTLQLFFPTYPILCVGNTVGILYVYLTLQEQLVSIDALTQLNNRNQLNQYLSTKLYHRHENKALYLLMMDIDYFKSINDRYGHVEGDNALVLVADCLRKACTNRHYFIGRYGGDEFVVICELEAGEDIAAVCEDIRARVKALEVPYPLSLSIGYAKCTDDIKNQQQFIDEADKELYKAKQARPHTGVTRRR